MQFPRGFSHFLASTSGRSASVCRPHCTPRQLRSMQAVANEVSPTFVERKNQTDGKWDRQDMTAVREALEDANLALIRKQLKTLGKDVMLGMSKAELQKLATDDGQPAYRGKQLWDGVMKGAKTLDEITNVPQAWRQQLTTRGISTGRSTIHHTVAAKDGTKKFLLRLFDGRVVETVGIPLDGEGQRLTVCVSSQVGCPMRCSFCATGKGGFARNLMVHEIVDQVLTVQEQFKTRVSNVVFMGMGEPLLNLPAVLRAVEVLNQDVGIGARHLTVSTVGVPNAILRLAECKLQFTLAISIHAASQELRESLIPSAKVYPLEAILADCAAYFAQTGRRVTFEYTLLAGVNDQPQHARQLAALLKRHDLRSHVNLIPWNPVSDASFARPSKQAVRSFHGLLEAAGVAVSIRVTRGMEAAAACGQLRNDFVKLPVAEPGLQAAGASA